MNEALLQSIWQYSLYRPGGLFTTSGEPVTVVHPGMLNRHSGPDFSGARIRIGSTLLAGAIEMHLRSSDWIKHAHSSDEAYKSVVLHVVLEDDVPNAAPGIPVLVLGPHIPPEIPAQYDGLLQTAEALPCANQHQKVSEVVKESWLTRMLSQRWERRFAEYEMRLAALSGDFAGLLYERLAAGMGFKVNAEPFTRLAQSIPLSILLKNRTQLSTLEALLFGMSGLLPREVRHPYAESLKAEFAYLQHKYSLQPIATHSWKFLRMHPANFPTMRIAQFASMLHHLGENLMALLDMENVAEAVEKLQVPVNEYWHSHSTFNAEKEHLAQEKFLGKSSAETLVINVLAPLKYLRAKHSGSDAAREKAEAFLDQLSPEKNSLIRPFSTTGWKPRSASHSQGMLELYNYYCSRKDCLNCAVGLKILRSAAVSAVK